MKFDIFKEYFHDETDESYPFIALSDLCPDPSTWGEVNGEPRRFLKGIQLSTFLKKHGYDLILLTFIYEANKESTPKYSDLRGLCCNDNGIYQFCLSATKCFVRSAWWDKEEPWLEDIYVSDYLSTFKFYCPTDAYIRFNSVYRFGLRAEWEEVIYPKVINGHTMFFRGAPDGPVYSQGKPHRCGSWRGYTLEEENEIGSCGYSDCDEYYYSLQAQSAYEKMAFGMHEEYDEYGESVWEF